MNLIWLLLLLLLLFISFLLSFLTLFVESTKEVGERGDSGIPGERGLIGIPGEIGPSGEVLPYFAVPTDVLNPEALNASVCKEGVALQVNVVKTEGLNLSPSLPAPNVFTCYMGKKAMVFTYCPRTPQEKVRQQVFYGRCSADRFWQGESWSGWTIV